jgi:hypothetical protein
MKKYIEYIKSLNINKLEELVDKYESNQISFEDFQLNVINYGEVSLNVFEKEIKLKIMLDEKESM